MKRYLILILLFSFCGGGSETTAVEDTTTTSSSSTSTSTSTTSSSTTTTTLPISTSTTTSPVSIIEVDPAISITCQPSATDDGEYLSFNIKVTKGSNDIYVVNIVSWFDSTRTDDLFISDSLPENEGASRELSYKVDSSFAKYEIEVLVMDENENVSTDYCLYNVPVPTTTTLPKSTGVGFDDNGNYIAPALELVEIIKPNIVNGEIFEITYQDDAALGSGADFLMGNELKIKVKIIPGTYPLTDIEFWFGVKNNDSDRLHSLVGSCRHFFGKKSDNTQKDAYHSELQDDVLYDTLEFTFQCGDGQTKLRTFYRTGEIFLNIISLRFGDDRNITGDGMSYWGDIGLEPYSNAVFTKENIKTIRGEVDQQKVQIIPNFPIFKINQ